MSMALKRKSPCALTTEKPLLVSYMPKNLMKTRSKTKQSLGTTVLVESPKPKRKPTKKAVKRKADVVEWRTRFLDEPISEEEAKTNWPERYNAAEEERKRQANLLKRWKKDGEHEHMIVQAKHHFKRVIVDERFVYDLNDDAHVQSDVEDEPYICKIVELFQGVDGICYFTAQWFYRAVDTIIEEPHNTLINDKRLFFSEIRDTNAVFTLRKKLKIAMISLNETTPPAEECDYFCNLKYLLPFSTFEALPPSATMASSGCSTISTETEVNRGDATLSDVEMACQVTKAESTLLDLYSGCGAMSTGLTIGAELAGLKLVTKWAVDMDEHACESMQYNHPETRVLQGKAEDFLSLLKEWEKLCVYFSLEEGLPSEEGANPYGLTNAEDEEADDDEGGDESDTEVAGEIFVVEEILDICYGNPKNILEQEPGLHFKVRWNGYGPSHDTWEPIQGLRNCKGKIQEFVERGHKSSILPLPGSVDVICGGPPCQGISGFNRFRNTEEPLSDKKNEQLEVYMNIVEFLKPKYVLMENVVDMLKYSKGFMARYAVGRMIQMNYQTRMGMMAAGAYGLAQYRMRFFLWGARSNETLPQFPLPTHDVDKRGSTPTDFSSNLVVYDEGHNVSLAPKLLLKDIISDLPKVENGEKREEMEYGKAPETPFQEVIRLGTSESTEQLLYNHVSLKLNQYDIQRVQQIPKRKGACFRDLRGVRVRPNNVVELDPEIERIFLAYKQPLVPDYSLSYEHGKSIKPFGRLWWDETVSTVVTRAEPHNQIILHPEQDRVLTVRENARLQGFPDHYKLFGPTKQQYCQVGNAVAVPVAKALGFALGKAFQGLSNDDPLLTLPKGFPHMKEDVPSESSENSS